MCCRDATMQQNKLVIFVIFVIDYTTRMKRGNGRLKNMLLGNTYIDMKYCNERGN